MNLRHCLSDVLRRLTRSGRNAHRRRTTCGCSPQVSALESRILLTRIQLSVNHDVLHETNSGTITVTVQTDEPVTGTQQVDLVASGDGITAADYVLELTRLTIPDGGTTATTRLSAADDDLVERPLETLILGMANPTSGLRPGGAVARQIRIHDNDEAVVTISGSSALETDGTVHFTVSLSRLVDVDVQATISTADGTASSPDDYSALNSQVVTIPAGSFSQDVAVAIVDTTVSEADEHFFGNVTSVEATDRAVSLGTTQLDQSHAAEWGASVQEAITADGMTMIFTAVRDAAGGLGLYSVPVAGGPITRLTAQMPTGGNITDFQLSPDGRFVVYLADQEIDSVFELFSLSLETQQVKKLNQSPVNSGDVSNNFAITADSTRVVYLGSVHNSFAEELFSVPITGGEIVRLNPEFVTGHHVRDFSVSADDSHVVYIANQDLDAVDELYSVPLTGGTPVRLNPDISLPFDVTDFIVSPDSSHVAFLISGGGSASADLYSVPLAGGIARQLHDAATDGGGVTEFQITQDSNRIVYVAQQIKLLSVALSGGTATDLLADSGVGGFVSHVSISDDSQQLVFNLDSGGFRRLHTVPVTGGDVVMLDASPAQVNSLDRFIPDFVNEAVVFLSDQTTSGVYGLHRAPLDGTAATQLVAAQDDGPFVWRDYRLTDDGLNVLYTLSTGEVEEVFSVPSSGGTPVRLNATLTRGGDAAIVAYVPQSHRVIYDADQTTDDLLEVYSVSANGGDAVNLVGPFGVGGDVFSFAVTANDSHAVYIADHTTNNINELYSVALDSGTVTQLNSPLAFGGDVTDFVLSPDGRYVIYRADADAPGEFQLYQVAINGGQVTKLNLSLERGTVWNDFAVTPDSRRVVYRQFHADAADELFSVPITGGAVETLNGPLASGGRVTGFAITVDGSHVVYRADETVDNDFELYAVSPDGGSSVRISGPLTQGGDVDDFVLSPMSDRVVYSVAIQTDSGRVRELHSAALFPNTDVRLNTELVSGGEVIDFAISSDGAQVVYLADQEYVSHLELYSIPIAGGQTVKLNGTLPTGGSTRVRAFQITPHDSRVVYTADQNVYSVPLTGGVSQRLNPEYPSGRSVRSFRVSDDGQFVIFVANPDAVQTDELYSVPTAGGAVTKINRPLSGTRSIDDYLISPAGDEVFYQLSAVSTDRFGLYRVPLSGGTSTGIAGRVFVGGVVPEFVLTSDGDRVVYFADPELDASVGLYVTPVNVQAESTIVDVDNRTVPEVLAPTSTIRDLRPVIQWTRVQNAVSYEVWLQLTGVNNNPVLNPTVTTTHFVVPTDLQIGRYRTWVRANLSNGTKSDWSSEVFDVSQPIAVHDVPFFGTDRRPTLTWDTPTPGGMTRVYISNLTTRENGIVDTVVADGRYTFFDDLSFGTYRIWVRAVGPGNYQAEWSEPQDYYLGPQPLAPTGPTVESQPEFSWTTIEGAATYQVYITAPGGVLVNEAGITGTTFTPSAALPNADFRWWVRGFTADGSAGPWSELAEFNTGGRSKVTWPDGTISDNIPEFHWPAVPTAQSYEIYVSKTGTPGVVYRKAGLTNTTYPSLPLENGDYKVWIRTTLDNGSSFWGRGVAFSVDVPTTGLQIGASNPVGPGFDRNPQFVWTPATGFTSYDLYLHDGESAILQTDLDTSWTPETSLAADEWTWFIRGVSSAGTPGPWSLPAGFNASGRTTLLAPAASASDTTPLFTWQPVAGAVRYVLQVDNLTTDTSQVIREDNLTDESFTPKLPLAVGEYRAWVRAISSNNMFGPWSRQRDFVVTNEA